MFQGGNMTSYEAYPQMDYMNDYNKTGKLHLKYKTMNQIEVPQMNFAQRQDKLDINRINKIDIDNIIKTNNITPLENIAGELIYQEIKEEDYDDQNLPKLLKSFQYALEYLYAKQSKLDQTNKKLSTEYKQLIQQSEDLEDKLKTNKQKISKKKAMKNEHEFLLLTYESLVNFNCNPTENTNIMMKNIRSNYGENITDYERNKFQGFKTNPRNVRFYCHICNGKYFNTELGLENHMKKRHLAQIRQKSQKEKEEMKIGEIQDFMDKRIEETKNHYQNLLFQKNDMISKENIKDEINLIKRDNNENLKLILENEKNKNEEIVNMVKELNFRQDKYNQNMLNIFKEEIEKNEKREMQNLIKENSNKNELDKIITSIENLKETVKNQEKKNSENNAKINQKLDNLNIAPNPNSNKINYNINTKINQNINKNIKIVPENDYNNINNNLNDNNNNNELNIKNSEIHSPKNTIIETQIKKEIVEEEKINDIPKDNNILQNENDNKKNTDENKNINKENNNIMTNNLGEEENNKKDNINFISQGDFMSNNFNNYKESQIQGIDEKEISISQMQNNNILNSNIDMSQNNENNEPNLKNQQNQNKDLGTIPEISQKNEEMTNPYSKTDPNAFNQKDKNEENFQPQKTFTNNINDKLFKFAKDFENRDKPILTKKDLNINDLNGFTKEIVEDQTFKNNIADNKNLENYINNKAQEKNFENIKNLSQKSEGELLDIIKNTLNNINKINEKSQVAGLYFETMNKMIDFKMLENEEKNMREAYNKKGELKKSRSNSSKARIVIEEANKDIEESDNI